jgi:WD40 repeat protein
VHIWDVESGQELASIRTDRSVATDLLWSPDDNSIILNSRIRSNGRRGTAIDIFDWRSKAAPAARASASL